MPKPVKKKRFINKKEATSYRLIPGYVEGGDEGAYNIINETQEEKDARREEQWTYGIFYDDAYNYMKHLRSLDEQATLVASGHVDTDIEVQSASSRPPLPAFMAYADVGEEDEIDPEVLAALDDAPVVNIADADNLDDDVMNGDFLDDDFFEKAGGLRNDDNGVADGGFLNNDFIVKAGGATPVAHDNDDDGEDSNSTSKDITDEEDENTDEQEEGGSYVSDEVDYSDEEEKPSGGEEKPSGGEEKPSGEEEKPSDEEEKPSRYPDQGQGSDEVDYSAEEEKPSHYPHQGRGNLQDDIAEAQTALILKNFEEGLGFRCATHLSDDEEEMPTAEDYENLKRIMKDDADKPVTWAEFLDDKSEKPKIDASKYLYEDEDEYEWTEAPIRKPQFDCMSILSLSSNTRNRPTDIIPPKPEDKRKHKKSEGGDETNSESGISLRQLQAEMRASHKLDKACTFRPKDESVEEKKSRKQAIKEERKERRQEKKANKQVFAMEHEKMKRETAALSKSVKSIKIF